MSNRRLDEQFPIAANDPIRKTIKDLLGVVEARLIPLEAQQETLQGVVDEARNTAITRINDVLTPILVEAVDHFRTISRLFESSSDTSITIGLGARRFTIAEGDRNSFVPLEYLQIEAVANPANSMIAQTAALDRDSGALDVNVIVVSGSGTFNDWTLKISAPPDLVHAARTDNPHLTTAAQVGAYTTAQADSAIATAISNLVAAAPSTLNTLNEIALALGSDPNFATTMATALGNRVRFDAAQSLNATQQRQAQINMAAQKLHEVGKCYLARSGANLVLSPCDGNLLMINSALEVIPDAGVTLAPTGNAANTLYYIYAYMSGPTMMLEYSTTSYTVQPGTGVRIKSGDVTRTLVGMWSSSVSAASWSSFGCEGVSYFNPKRKTSISGPSSPTTTSASMVEMASAPYRLPFITFNDREVAFGIRGKVNQSTGAGATINLSYDGIAATLLSGSLICVQPSSEWNFIHDNYASYFGEARHYITGIFASGGGTLAMQETCWWLTVMG